MMTDEGDTQRLLGALVEGGKARGKQMDRIENTVNHLAEAQNETRIMVSEDRATVRAVKWTLGAVVVGMSALGLDWWQR